MTPSSFSRGSVRISSGCSDSSFFLPRLRGGGECMVVFLFYFCWWSLWRCFFFFWAVEKSVKAVGVDDLHTWFRCGSLPVLTTTRPCSRSRTRSNCSGLSTSHEKVRISSCLCTLKSGFDKGKQTVPWEKKCPSDLSQPLVDKAAADEAGIMQSAFSRRVCTIKPCKADKWTA